MKGDTKASIEFLQKFSPEGNWVLTSILPDGKTTTATFSDPSNAAKWIDDRQGVENIYFHVNPTIYPMITKASKEDIQRVAWLHVDIDPKQDETPAKAKPRAIKLLKSHNTPPTLIIDSGGGVQGFWRLEPDESLITNGSIEKAQELESYNIQLERDFGADACHNIDRIMRLPGTINLPTQRKVKKGRKPALAKVVEWNDNVYPIGKFLQAVRVQSPHSGLSEGEAKSRVFGNVPDIGVEELQQWAQENGKTISDHVLALIATGQDPINPTKYASRSETLFRVCCELVRLGVPDEMIYGVITGDNEIAVSVKDKPNWERYASRQIQRARENAIHPKLRELNEKHAVIEDIGGKCMVITEKYDPVMQREVISKQSFTDIRNIYCNILVELESNSEKPKLAPLGNFWLTHRNRRQYQSIAFSPGRDIEGCYNLWRGFACDARQGNNHESFLQHIYDNICSGNKEYYDYLIGWMANLVQRPDVAGQVAVVLRGKKGTGKSFFAKTIGHLFGRHYLQVSDSKHLVGSFNAHLRDTVLLFGDEAFFAGDKRHESVLKTLVTEEQLVIEGKGVDAEASPNYTHLILASNEEWVVPAGMDERRFFVLEVSDAQAVQHEYFKSIIRDMQAGGYQSLLHYLLTYDLSKYEVRKFPETEALHEQKAYSQDEKTQWFIGKLQDGQLLPEHSKWKPIVSASALYDDYILAMKDQAKGYRLSRQQFWKFLDKCVPGKQITKVKKKLPVQIENANNRIVTVQRYVWAYGFPPLQEMRDYWDKHKGGPYTWMPICEIDDDTDEDFTF